MSRSKLVLAVVGLATLVGWPNPPLLKAQAGAASPPVLVRVQVTQVKPDMVQQWQNLTRSEAIPAQKKAGMAWRQTWADDGPFGEKPTFITVQPIANLAQFDQPNAISRALGA